MASVALSVDQGDDWELVELPIKKIRTDGGCQPREEINRETVVEYAELMISGVEFPPVDVFRDDRGDYWMADGEHRRQAHLRAKFTTIVCRVRPGSKRDAVLFACSANVNHGLRRTNRDKLRAVMKMLNDDEWCLWNDELIAKKCGVSSSFVANQRPRSIQADANGKYRIQVRNGKETLVARPEPRPKVTPAVIPHSPPTIPIQATGKNPIHVFTATLRADDVTFRTNVKTDVGMAQVVTEDAVYHLAAHFNVALFLEAFGSVQLLRAALKVRRAVVVGPITPELEPFMAAARSFKVEFRPL